MPTCKPARPWKSVLPMALFVGAFWPVVPAMGQAPPAATVPADATVESLFVDFLHYARLGRFTMADAFARKLLDHPDLDPAALLDVANRQRKSLDTLLILIKNSSIGESAAKVLALLEIGEAARRKEAERIADNIAKLGGDPQQEYFALGHLVESGEYAVPAMVAALLDPAQAHLKARIATALPQIGKQAVGPLVAALAVRETEVRLLVIEALGKVGYPQAISHLRKLTTDANAAEQVKTAAMRAIHRIESVSGRSFPGAPDDLLTRLAEKYYDEDPSVQADPRLPDANVWRWDDTSEALVATVVPQPIFGSVMAMRCCEEALLLRNDNAEAIALWLAANIRRESRLGLDVESGDPDEAGEADQTRPDAFPRALYFSQAAGPRYALRALQRAIHDNDSTVALGAIKALQITAGGASLAGSREAQRPLVEALQFPDQVVRIRAALALATALPRTAFHGAAHVTATLASGLTLTGEEELLVVDEDESSLNRTLAALRSGDRHVIGARSAYAGLERARAEFQGLSGVVISTAVTEPPLATALAQLRGEFSFAKTPVVVLVEPTHSALAQEVADADPFTETVDAGADGAAFEAALDRASRRSGRSELERDDALALALECAEALRTIAADGRTVFDVAIAEPALIAVLNSPSEALQTASASVLALAPTSAAQAGIANLAFDAGQGNSLRIAAFSSLAESAKHHGNLLDPQRVAELIRIARDEPDLTIRTAASQALGALNLASNQASEIVRSYHGG